MSARFSKVRYYYCTCRTNRHARLEPGSCNAGNVRADALDADVWESIKGIFSDLPRLDRLLHIAQREEVSELDPKVAELEAIERTITETEHEAAALGPALRATMHIEAGIVTRTLEMDVREVNNRHKALCSRRETLQKDIRAARLTDDAIE